MSEISASAIKELREKTGAGMLDCRKALAENAGDMEAAIDWLRKKGLAAAAKKSGRTAAEGVVAVAVEGKKGAIIELNTETDFVARNEQFQRLARDIAQIALQSSGDVEALKRMAMGLNSTVQDEVAVAVATIGENIHLRRSAVLTVNKGAVASYIHNSVAPGMGKIGILIALESEADAGKLETLGKQVAMHIAAARPEALSVGDVEPQKLERERAVFKEQAAASGKPENVIEKMVEGRIRKYYEEVVLHEQIFVVDNKSKISQVVEQAAKELGAPVKITGFVRFQLGEGVEKQASDFAAEVAAAGGAAA
ncbi:MAG: elongation factor Ts [Alphaproteobacteria bacterium]|nr:elongation factor Ts [Alphaproteobacteria bacterium]